MKNMFDKIKQHKLKKNTIIVMIIFLIITFFNILSICIKSFSDFYRKYIFAHISNIFSRISNAYKYSIGESMIVIAVFIVILAIIILLAGFMKFDALKNLRKYYFRFVVYVLLYIYATETFNCFIMYHCSTIEETLYSNAEDNSDISDIEKLLCVYNDVADNINALSTEIDRNSNGDAVPDYTYDECRQALLNVSETFECLKGYFPYPKEIYYSNIMTQQYLEGVYFPFSMEANYNKLMYSANYPSVICHELSHLKGYIREDEANFISYAACINSDNKFIQYSGYLSVIFYLANDLLDYGDEDIINRMNKITETAYDDTVFVKQEIFDEIEENAVISTDTISEATDSFIDSNLKMNGVESGMDNYNEVVKLLILYYSKDIN